MMAWGREGWAGKDQGGSGGRWTVTPARGTDRKGGPGAWPGQLGASLTRAPTSPGILLGPRSLGRGGLIPQDLQAPQGQGLD